MEPTTIESDAVNFQQVTDLQNQVFKLRGDTTVLNRDLNAKHEQLAEEEQRLAILRSTLETLEDEYDRMTLIANNKNQAEMQVALQSLTEEMQRLQEQAMQKQNSLVGGIPVDSEYIAFIVDTSGSMFEYAWDRLMEEMISILDIYPTVKGIQIMNDMGEYMFGNYRGKWIPDTPGRRDGLSACALNVWRF